MFFKKSNRDHGEIPCVSIIVIPTSHPKIQIPIVGRCNFGSQNRQLITQLIATSSSSSSLFLPTMPVALRRRADHARQIMNVLSNDDENAKPSSSRNSSTTPEWTKEHLSLIIQDLQDSLNDRLAILASDTLKAKDAQKQSWFQSVVKIRKSVKGMTVKEFNEAHGGCDLLALLSVPVATTASSSANKKRDRAHELKTPAPSKGPKSINTISRTVKRGEAIL